MLVADTDKGEELREQVSDLADTDKGEELREQVSDLKELLYAYRHGIITEKRR